MQQLPHCFIGLHWLRAASRSWSCQHSRLPWERAESQGCSYIRKSFSVALSQVFTKAAVRGRGMGEAQTADLVQVIGQVTRWCSGGLSSPLAHLPCSIWTTCSALWPCLALRSSNQAVEQMSEWRTDFYISLDDSTVLPGFFFFFFFHLQSKDKAVISVQPGLPRWCSVKNLSDNAGDMGSILGQEDPLEKEMVTHPSILAWTTPWTE